MKKPTPFFLIALFINACTPYMYNTGATVSKFQHKEKYADKLETGSTLIASNYNYTIEKLPAGEYVQKIYYPDTRQITDYATYSDEKLTIKNGRYIEYWDDGTVNRKGSFTNNKKSGMWVDYAGYSKGKGEYINGKKNGLWVSIDSLGNKIDEFNFKENKFHGDFKKWNKDGKLIMEGVYNMGELVSEKIYVEDEGEANKEEFKIVETMPRFPSEKCDKLVGKEQKACSDEAMLRFIYGNIKYPAKAREQSVQGMAIVEFVVEKDGSISNVKSKRGICKEIKDECLRIVKTMPNWHPGMKDGESVRVHFNLPVKFKLEYFF